MEQHTLGKKACSPVLAAPETPCAGEAAPAPDLGQMVASGATCREEPLARIGHTRGWQIWSRQRSAPWRVERGDSGRGINYGTRDSKGTAAAWWPEWRRTAGAGPEAWSDGMGWEWRICLVRAMGWGGRPRMEDLGLGGFAFFIFFHCLFYSYTCQYQKTVTNAKNWAPHMQNLSFLCIRNFNLYAI